MKMKEYMTWGREDVILTDGENVTFCIPRERIDAFVELFAHMKPGESREVKVSSNTNFLIEEPPTPEPQKIKEVPYL